MTTLPLIRFAELLISRVCHDLVTPLGAISTGLELFQETATDEILNLVSQSAQGATTRASFFRAAFGAGSLSPQDTDSLLEKYFGETKLSVQWDSKRPTNAPFKEWGQLMLNATLCVNDYAPRGGTLHILSAKDALVALRLEADSIIILPGSLEAFKGAMAVDELTPRTVPCYFTYLLAQELGAECEVEHVTSSSELTFTIKKRA